MFYLDLNVKFHPHPFMSSTERLPVKILISTPTHSKHLFVNAINDNIQIIRYAL